MISLMIAASAQADRGGREVVAVEDITNVADCELTSYAYSDASRAEVIHEEARLVHANSVIHAERMSLREAEDADLQYIVTTDDPKADEAALDELKRKLWRGEAAPAAEQQLLLGCEGYFGKQLQYNAEGGRVKTLVFYENDISDCGDTMWIGDAWSILVRPLTPGEDLYWDEGRYGVWISNPAWDMGCKQLTTSSYQSTATPGWHVQDDGVYTDESINDTSFGCDWWGEEYTGQVQLTN